MIIPRRWVLLGVSSLVAIAFIILAFPLKINHPKGQPVPVPLPQPPVASPVVPPPVVDPGQNEKEPLPTQSAPREPAPTHDSTEPGFWTAEKLKSLQPLGFSSSNDAIKQSHVPNRLPTSNELERFESSEPWRDAGVFEQYSSTILPRPFAPSRQMTHTSGQWLAQTIPGDFRQGADSIFIMLKTGAETQWQRMPIHFMTTLTRTTNFALYSDSAGSMFGHEIINIMDRIDPRVLENEAFNERLLSYRQMHGEHWNWSPHMLKMPGGWDADKYKNIPMLLDAYEKNPNCDWYVWMDDDSYVFYDNLAAWLGEMDPNEKIYAGAPTGGWKNDTPVTFAHGGSVVVVSRAVAEGLFQGRDSKTTKELLYKWALETVDDCCGDAMVAYMLYWELDVKLYGQYSLGNCPFQGEGLNGLIIGKHGFCNPIISWHHLTGHDGEVLYEYERLWNENRYITYRDIYRDFILPFITEERPNWMLTGDQVYVNSEWEDSMTVEDTVYHPSQSKEQCVALCQALVNCTAWSWNSEKKECKRSEHGISLGMAANEINKQSGWSTGWLLDRIRSWRAESPCDPLEKTAEGWNDDHTTSEGWFLRQLNDAGHYHGRPKLSTIPKKDTHS